MFEDSLVESTGRIRTRSHCYAAGSLALQAALLAVAFLIPYIYPAALPRQALLTLLAVPPVPAAMAPVAHAPASHATPAIQSIALAVPRIIPDLIAREENSRSKLAGMGELLGIGIGNVQGAAPSLGPTPPPPTIKPEKPKGPMRVSAGVAAGQLLAPIQPVYPLIAREAHVQGTVIIDAAISCEGMVEQARVVSGSPLLAQAALSAVRRARYRPYLLNGEPIAVETTIRIIFSLGD